MCSKSSTSRVSVIPSVVAISFVMVVVLLQIVAWLPVRDTGGKDVRIISSSGRLVTMQGWAFFTKSPRDDILIPYTKEQEENEWNFAARGPNVQARYIFGLNRESRLTEFDVRALTNAVDEQGWIDCEDTSKFERCIKNEVPHNVVIKQYDPKLCGLTVITRSPPIPWAYRNATTGMPGKVLYLNVQCEGVA